MKFQNPFFLFICLSAAIYCTNKDEKDSLASNNDSPKQYKLIITRGAFHYYRFELTSDKIKFIPDSTSKYDKIKYSLVSETKLDSLSMMPFFKEIEEKGFWELKDSYKTKSSCGSELVITLEKDGKSKTVICEDFERGCPDVIKYIDKKVVELEGNDLKRIYLPG